MGKWILGDLRSFSRVSKGSTCKCPNWTTNCYAPRAGPACTCNPQPLSTAVCPPPPPLPYHLSFQITTGGVNQGGLTWTVS